MPNDLASHLFKDLMYKQEGIQYLFKDDKFVLVDRDKVADAVLKSIDTIFEKYHGKDGQLSIERVYDPIALNQAISRYSRDVFGEARLHARILHFQKKYNIQEEDVSELINFMDYGLKVDSVNPYITRRISYLFYWFSIFKPFRVIPKANISENESIYKYLENHNEYITYILVIMMLDCLNMGIDVHECEPIFNKFLYDLHYRKLSRSALEFFLKHHLFPKKRGAYPLNVPSIDQYVKKSIGTFSLGVYIGRTYSVKFIGRSDTDLHEELRNYLNTEYTHFKIINYENNPVAAYTNECLTYHNHLKNNHELDNKTHPEKPQNAPDSLICPICGK